VAQQWAILSAGKGLVFRLPVLATWVPKIRAAYSPIRVIKEEASCWFSPITSHPSIVAILLLYVGAPSCRTYVNRIAKGHSRTLPSINLDYR
jgi:hypothetical protein